MSRSLIRATVTYDNATPWDQRDEWQRNANPWTVVLRYQGRRMTVPFYTGSGWTREPTAADVVDCLCSDASGIECARDFDDWCSDLGMDTDSRKAERIYRQSERQTAALRRLLGADYDDVVREDEDQRKRRCA